MTSADRNYRWAKTYLVKAGLLTSRKRGQVQITERGLLLLKQGYGKIDRDILKQFPEFAEFINGGKEEKSSSEKSSTTEMTPEEELKAAYQSIRQRLAQELLEANQKLLTVLFRKIGDRTPGENGLWRLDKGCW